MRTKQLMKPKRKPRKKISGADFPVARKGRTPTALDDVLPEAPSQDMVRLPKGVDTPKRLRRRL